MAEKKSTKKFISKNDRLQGERMTAYRKVMGKTQEEIAMESGYSVRQWLRMENGEWPKKVRAREQAEERVAATLGVPVSNLRGRNGESIDAAKSEAGEPTTVRWVPKISGHLSAGKREHTNEVQIDGQTLPSFDQIPVADDLLPQGKFCAIQVEGDSMEPQIQEGSLVFVDLASRSPDDLVGKTVAAFVPDVGVFVKQLKRTRQKNFLLHSFNPQAEDIEIPKGMEGFVVREVVGELKRLK